MTTPIRGKRAEVDNVAVGFNGLSSRVRKMLNRKFFWSGRELCFVFTIEKDLFSNFMIGSTQPAFRVKKLRI